MASGVQVAKTGAHTSRSAHSFPFLLFTSLSHTHTTLHTPRLLPDVGGARGEMKAEVLAEEGRRVYIHLSQRRETKKRRWCRGWEFVSSSIEMTCWARATSSDPRGDGCDEGEMLCAGEWKHKTLERRGSKQQARHGMSKDAGVASGRAGKVV